MKKKLFLFLSSVFITGATVAQVPYPSKMETKKGIPVVCPADFKDVNTFVPMPAGIEEAIAQNKNGRSAATKKSNFVVEYVDFPNNARAAFQRAVDIWEQLLVSPVPIRVLALWQPLGPNVLGSATAGDFNRNFPGTPKAFTWYPIALAEKLAGQELNSPNEYDIICRFSSEQNWFTGTNANPAQGQFDLTSVVLHELCHGLGFISSMEIELGNGQYGFGTSTPFAFDRFIENGQGQSLIDTSFFKNPSTQLRDQLTSNNLFFNSPLATSANNNVLPKLYAPAPYSSGSSISHLDDGTYGSGNVNSLMTSTASIREVNFNPGPIVINMFKDMGWASSSIVHNPMGNFPSVPSVDIVANLLSDTTFVEGSAKVFYTINEANFANAKELPLERVSGTTFKATIPVSSPQAVVRYYLVAQDNFNKEVTSPPSAPDFIWSFEVGVPDQTPPDITHFAPDIVPAGISLDFLVNAVDDFENGVESVQVNYELNGEAKPAISLKKYDVSTDNISFSQGSADRFAYLSEGAIPALKSGDRVRYQVVAKDKAGNTAIYPTTYTQPQLESTPTPTFFEVLATDLKGDVRASYVSDFSQDDDDFALIGFTIGTAPGLLNGSLYTKGGYPNGLGSLDPVTQQVNNVFEANQIALLRFPIKLRSEADSAVITFDEIVLVEPGESGARFGSDEFWDYVVVEGSRNGGASWVPFADGYDSGAESVWRTEFNNFGPGDAPFSQGRPNPSLYKPRTILLTGTNDFARDQEVLIRFRLYSDQFVKGWGWSIDNLRIQSSLPKPTATEPIAVSKVQIYPNPSSDFLTIQLPVSHKQLVETTIFDQMGRKMSQDAKWSDDKEFLHQLRIDFLPSGSYVVQIKTDEGTKTKRFVVNR